MLQKQFNHYIISSKSSLERRHYVRNTFLKQGITPIFFDAIIGTELTTSELQEKVADNGLLRLGEIGCALSHLAIYKKFLTTNQKHIFIFEDDVILENDFISSISDIETFIDSQKKATVILLYKANAIMWPAQNINNNLNQICQATSGSGAHAYVINRIAAKNLLKVQCPLRFEIDAWLIYKKLDYIKIYCLSKNLVNLNTMTSEKSLIDTLSSRKERSLSMVKKIKDSHYKYLLYQRSFKERMIIQVKRLNRHIQNILH